MGKCSCNLRRKTKEIKRKYLTYSILSPNYSKKQHKDILNKMKNFPHIIWNVVLKEYN